MKDESRRFMSEQFCRLGEMIGDGIHHEEKWIEREYKKLMNTLYPEINKMRRKQKNEMIDAKMNKLIIKSACVSCGGKLKQSRSGSYVCYCVDCKCRHKAK